MQSIYKIASLTPIAVMLFILWTFQLVWGRSYETVPMVMSGDAMALSILTPLADDDPRWSQAYVNAYWAKTLDAAAHCPIVRTNPDQIEHVITQIGQLHLTEAAAVQAAKRDIAANAARIYLPAAGAGEATCTFARAMKAMGIQATLLNSMPRDTYGYRYVQRYNNTIVEFAGLQVKA